jgi:amidase
VSRPARAADDRRRTVSVVDVVTSYPERIESVNPTLDALVGISHEEALDAARSPTRWWRPGRRSARCTGADGDQDQHRPAGHATRDGIVAMADAIAPADIPSTRRLRRAGAIFVGRSSSPAFACPWFADNDLHGAP